MAGQAVASYSSMHAAIFSRKERQAFMEGTGQHWTGQDRRHQLPQPCTNADLNFKVHVMSNSHH